MVSHGVRDSNSGCTLPCKEGRLAAPVVLAGIVSLVLLLAACGGSRRGRKVKLPPPINPRFGWTETGVASWYGHPYHGRRTSNGEVYDMDKMTAAHKRLPFDTWVSVRNLVNGRETEVRINDRGPFVKGRIIDLSRTAATRIGMISAGTARVRLTVIRPPGQRARDASGQRGQPRQPASGKQQDQFDIQVGVFSNRANAQGLARRVSKRGHATNVEQFSQAGAPRYRVVVIGGRLSQARARMKKLKVQGIDGILRPRRGD